MFTQCNRLGVGLTTLFVFALAGVSARGQVVILPTSGNGWAATAAALDPATDDVMVVGSGVSQYGEFVVSGVTRGGAINRAFGGGLVTTSIKVANLCYACAIQADGKTIAAGQYSANNKPIGFALARYNTDGTLDTTFNKDGTVTTDFAFATGIRAIVLQDDGKIVAAGGWSSSNLSLARYTKAGKLDATFGAGGTVTLTMPVPSCAVRAVELQSDGEIIVQAFIENKNALISMALVRFTTTGKLDTTFGANGIAVFNANGQDTWPGDIIVDDDDSIIAVGSCGISTSELVVARFAPDGDDVGYVTEDFGSAAFGSAVDLEANGAIVVTGGAANGNLLVARFNSDGTLDDTFGSIDPITGAPQGYVADYPYSPSAHSALVQADGKIVAVGTSSGGVVAVVRYNSDGTPDTTF